MASNVVENEEKICARTRVSSLYITIEKNDANVLTVGTFGAAISEGPAQISVHEREWFDSSNFGFRKTAPSKSAPG